MSEVRAGVIGAGALGFHHVRIMREMPGVAFAGFYEANPERAAFVARELGAPAFPSVKALLDAIDAATIVVPTPANWPSGVNPNPPAGTPADSVSESFS